MSSSPHYLNDSETIFPGELLADAAAALDAAKKKGVRLATAETVTAGLVSACLTSVSGASQIFDRGYVLYHESAKATGLGVDEDVSKQHGAVSAEVTQGLAEGLLSNSGAAVTVAITGYAGPGGGDAKNPGGPILPPRPPQGRPADRQPPRLPRQPRHRAARSRSGGHTPAAQTDRR